MAEKKKPSFIKKLGESLLNTVALTPRALLATTTCAGQLLRTLLATDVNGWQSLPYKQTIKNYGKKLTYALSAPVTAFSPALKQKREKLDKVPGPKERNKDMVRYDYMGRTSGRVWKYSPQLAIDATLLWSEWLESMLYLDKESPMYTGPWPTITQKLKNFGKSIVMPFEPIFRRSQNKLWLFGGKKAAKKEETKKEEPKKEEQKKPEIVPKPEAKPVEVKKDKPVENPHSESDVFQKKIKEKDDKFVDKELADRGYESGGKLSEKESESKWEKPESKTKKDTSKSWNDKPKNIDDIKNQQKAESVSKSNAEIEAKKRKNLSKEDKGLYKKDFENILGNDLTERGVLAWAKKHNKGNDLEQILKTLDKENVTFATFIDDEILAKTKK